jgi:hypothetical protein
MENWGRFRDSQYYISDLGRIKNKHGRILKVSVNKKGYTKIVLRLDKQKVNFSLYRIVAEVFIGDVKGKIVDHIDRDKLNNTRENLRIVNKEENVHNQKKRNFTKNNYKGHKGHSEPKPQENKPQTIHELPPVNAPVVSNSRSEEILKIIKDNGKVTIKDISNQIKNCSEKTIQRELIKMVSLNQIKKEGERRWSTYSIQ